MSLLTQVHVPLSDCNMTKMWAEPCTNPEKGCLVYKGALSSHKTSSQRPYFPIKVHRDTYYFCLLFTVLQ